MWIRSQDKRTLCQATNLRIVKKSTDIRPPFINSWFIYNNTTELGEYWGEKDAMLVLSNITFNLTQQNSEYTVYSMPEASWANEKVVNNFNEYDKYGGRL